MLSNIYVYCLLLLLQCRNGSGVCPDTMAAGGNGYNNVFDVTGQVSSGLTCVRYFRMLTTSELPCYVCVCVCACACVSAVCVCECVSVSVSV